MTLVHSNKTVGTKSEPSQGSKYFPFPKVNSGLMYRELHFVLRVKCFRTCKTSAEKINFCSTCCAEMLGEIRAANTFLPPDLLRLCIYLH